MNAPIDIEGFTPDAILALSESEIDTLVLCDEPLVFRAGSASLLGQFRVRDGALVMELAQIEGGGEGVLPVLWSLADRYARRRGLAAVEWIVHAVSCAKPNPKLRRILELKGFVVEDIPGIGEAYRLRRRIGTVDWGRKVTAPA